LTVLAMCLGESSPKAAPTTAAMTAATVTDAAAATSGQQLLVAEAQHWGVKVYQNFDCEEISLSSRVVACGQHNSWRP